MINRLDAFYLEQQEPNQSCLLALRQLLLSQQHVHLSETMKYSMPCFLLASRALCYLWTDKKSGEPYILWVEGHQMKHPSLEAGDRKRMKIQRINPWADLPVATIHQVLDEAIQLYQTNA